MRAVEGSLALPLNTEKEKTDVQPGDPLCLRNERILREEKTGSGRRERGYVLQSHIKKFRAWAGAQSGRHRRSGSG